MSANVETMFSVRETPWHGLGRIVIDAPASREALELAGLDWQVESRNIYSGTGAMIPGYRANVRSTDESVLGVVSDRKVQEFINEFFPITEDLTDGQRKNNLRLQEDLKARYYNAPDLEWVGKNGWRFVNAVSDFATHADPIRKTRNYNENLFLRTAEGNPMIDKAYKMVLAAA